MLDGLNDSFIISGDGINVDDLFTEDETEQEESPKEEPIGGEKKDKEDKIEETTEEGAIDADDLFNSPEGVGSEEKEDNTRGKEDTFSDKESGASPKTNFYSSIATALKDDGVFPDLDDEILSSIKEPEDFSNAVEKVIQARFDERQKRIDAALNAGIEPDEIKQYENTINSLNSIKEEHIKDESDKGERLRKNLIYQDFINRGYSEARAKREVEKSFNAGTDIDDAKEALESNREFFSSQYQDLIKEAQEDAKMEQERIKEEAAQLKKSMLEDKEVFKDIPLDKSVREKAFQNIAKPIFKTEDGEYLTAIQKYEYENPVEFRKNLAVLFTLTDGFKDLGTLLKGKVKKEVRQSVRELEHKLRTPSRPVGNPQLVGLNPEDTEAYAGKGWKLDI